MHPGHAEETWPFGLIEATQVELAIQVQIEVIHYMERLFNPGSYLQIVKKKINSIFYDQKPTRFLLTQLPIHTANILWIAPLISVATKR